MTYNNKATLPPPASLPSMASVSPKTRLSLLSLFAFFLLARATLDLDRSDHDALLIVHRELGVNGQRLGGKGPCQSAGGRFCELRLLNDTYVLRITRIVLKSRQLTGFLSPAIGRLSELRELSLPDNFLAGQIPPQIADCRKLEVLNLRNNQFFGHVPPGLSSLVRLRVIDLASNEFSGNLNFLKHFPNLEKLSLEHNKFSGKVPSSLQSFWNLRLFNISGNNLLEGLVPAMDEVPLPKRYVFAENSTSRNQTTSVAPSPSSSKNSNTTTDSAHAPEATTGNKSKKKKKKVGTWILGFLVGAVAGSLSGLLFSVAFKLLSVIVKGKGKGSGPQIFSQMIKKAKDLAFLEKEDGLASLQLIGKGGCGEVYKAELPGSDGKMIAIKKIVPIKDASELNEEETKNLDKKMRQIKSEIQTVGKIRHRNLLPLLAHVPRPDCHYLIYELMKNGSLEDALNLVGDGTRELDWLARHKIAIGIAAGLEYLHLSHSPRIIHRDLKPANVLLDDDMEARIADFGLAKIMPDAHTHVTASNLAGTAGYMAPEYYQTLKFTDKCDIYSFGVLLGVLVMGKFPTDKFFQQTSELLLVKWMRNVMTSEEPLRAIDPKLMGNGYEEQMLLVLKIACFCTLDDPKQRPNSKEVRLMLSQINH